MWSWFTELDQTSSTVELQFSRETLHRLLEQEQLCIAEVRVLNRKSKRSLQKLLIDVVKSKIKS